MENSRLVLLKMCAPQERKASFSAACLDLSFIWQEKAMAPHSSTIAWKIPRMEEPGGLQSMGSLGVGHNWSDLAAAAEY